ncbi:MAG TPA: serine hydrolase domain-containing protein [Puia sp.]|jgi:CubicO group peptidase (beta-lactamase class C family)|nr:serine hydrolase domain-containing protein [Puia sp.]
MNRYSITAIILLALAASCSHAQQPDKVYSKDIEDKIRQVETHLGGWVQLPGDDAWTLADRMKFYGVKGVSIAVIHNNQVEWARGYGWADEGERRPVTTNTMFQAGSISKSLNAVGVMLLVQRHRLDLNTDINDYLRTWKFPYDSVSKGKKITLGNLLSHTGGLSVHGFPGYEKTDSLPALDQVLDGKRPANTDPVRSIVEPGKQFIYSGGGTTISQLIVMNTTGIPYDQYMWENVLQPMGMDHSSYAQPPPASKDRATGYLRGGKEVPGKYHIYPEQAAAGLWTTPSDLGKYIIESQLAFEGKSAKVLDQTSTRTRLSPYIDSIVNNGTREGLGVFLFQKGKNHYFNHDGSDVGFLSNYYGCFDNGDGVVVQINNDVGFGLIRELVNSVATVYHWDEFYQPEHPSVIQPRPDSLARNVGVYTSDNRDTVRIYLQGDQLYYISRYMVANHPEQMYFTSPVDFLIYEEGWYAYFKDGRLYLKLGKTIREFVRLDDSVKYNRDF